MSFSLRDLMWFYGILLINIGYECWEGEQPTRIRDMSEICAGVAAVVIIQFITYCAAKLYPSRKILIFFASSGFWLSINCIVSLEYSFITNDYSIWLELEFWMMTLIYIFQALVSVVWAKPVTS